MASTTPAVDTTEIVLNSRTYSSNWTSNEPNTTMVVSKMSVTHRPTTGFTTNKYGATSSMKIVLSSVNDITTQNGLNPTSTKSNNVTTNELTTVIGNNTMPITTEQMTITNSTESTVYIDASPITTPYTVGTSETLSNISVTAYSTSDDITEQTVLSSRKSSTRSSTTRKPTADSTTLSTKSRTSITPPTDHQTTYLDRTSSTILPTDATAVATTSSVVTGTPTTESTTPAVGSSNTLAIALGVSLGAIALIVIIIVIAVLCMRRKPNRRRPSMDDAEYNYKHDGKKQSASQKNTLPPLENTGLYFQPEVGWDTSDSPSGLDNPSYDTTGLEFINGTKPGINENTYSNVQDGVNNNDDKDEEFVERRSRSIIPVENRQSVGLLDMGDDDMSATNAYEKLYHPTSSFMTQNTGDEGQNIHKAINPSDSTDPMEPIIENHIDPDIEHNDKPTSEHDGNASDRQDDEMVETNALLNEIKTHQEIPSKQITTEL